jgi:hypothetical protein
MNRQTWKVLGLVIAGAMATGQGCPTTLRNPRLTQEIVTLGTTLDPNDPNLLVGTEIPLTKITGGKLAGIGVVEPGCPNTHLHAADPSKGIMINGKGPFFDPAPNGCGYGRTNLMFLPQGD